MNTNNVPNTQIPFTIRGEKKMIELQYTGEFTTGLGEVMEQWTAIGGQIALAKIGRGTKMWATSLHFWRSQKTNKFSLLTICINNRNNTTLVAWNNLEPSDNRRSQHIAQVGLELLKAKKAKAK